MFLHCFRVIFTENYSPEKRWFDKKEQQYSQKPAAAEAAAAGVKTKAKRDYASLVIG